MGPAVDWLGGAGDLSHEAFFLAHTLAELAPNDPEVLGLTALIGFIEARQTRGSGWNSCPRPGTGCGVMGPRSG